MAGIGEYKQKESLGKIAILARDRFTLLPVDVTAVMEYHSDVNSLTLSMSFSNYIVLIIDEDFALQATECSKQIKRTILLAAEMNTATLELAENLGVAHILQKPVNTNYLIYLVRNYLKSSAENALLGQRVPPQMETDRAAIVNNRDFLQGILNSSTLVSIVLTDLDQNVLYWNKGAENIFGYASGEMLGDKITKIYPSDMDTANIVCDLQENVKVHSDSVHAKMRQITKDGREVITSLAISAMKGPNGAVQGILGIGQDITEEYNFHEQLLASLELREKIQDVSIFTLAKLAESRDEETGSHLKRIQHYCSILCRALTKIGPYKSTMSDKYIQDLIRSSVLHDIGKVGIPDTILLSDQVFSEEDYLIMKKHTVLGGQALEKAVEVLGTDSFLSMGRDIAYYHHEKWDGSGYPQGLSAEEIPLSARIVALADVYDALTTSRRYKSAFSHEKAMALIIDGKSRHFDPFIVDALMICSDEFASIKCNLVNEL